MQNKKSGGKKHAKREMELEELLAEDRFDEEDEDSVTDDTLEFLSLDDETIASYQSEHGSGRRDSRKRAARYRDEEEDDEEYYGGAEDDEDDDDEYYAEDDEDDEEDDDEYYGEDDDEDEDDEDDDGEYYGDEDDDEDDEEDEDDEYYAEDDEDEDDEYYGDEDDEYDDDEREGVIARIGSWLAEMSTLDMVVAMFGVFVIAGVIVTGTLFANAKTVEKQVEAFATVGEEIEGISVIGEGGLLAVAESARLSDMLDVEEEEQQEEAEGEEKDGIEVTLNLTSIQSDLKIKFVNKSTGKLISGVPFEVEVTGGGKSYEWQDDDKDGIIYKTEIAAGTYSVKAKPLSGGEYEKYKLPSGAVSAKVSDKIAYKKVDVADEIKDESQINVAAEEKAGGDIAVESQLTDTVEWVESTKTPIDSEDNFTEIKKDDIPDPSKSGKALSGFVKTAEKSGNYGFALLSETGLECTCGTKCKAEEPNQDCAVCKTDPSQCKGEEKKKECTCKDRNKCTSSDDARDCPVCQEDYHNCEGKEAEQPKECICTTHCTDEERNTDCPVCSENPGKCKISAPAGPTDAEKLSDMRISSDSLSLKVNDSATLTVSGQYESEASVEWSGANSSVSVSGSGRSVTVKALAAGDATITATVSIGDSQSKKTLSCKVTVQNTEPTEQQKADSFALNKTSLGLVQGASETLSVSSSGNYKASSVTWNSDDKKVATVDGGKVTAVAAGKTKIKAEVKVGDASKILECDVNVTAKHYKIASIDGSGTLTVGETGKVTVKLEPADGQITWKSENEKIVKIESTDGDTAKFKAIAAGKTKITAVCGDAKGEWSVEVSNDLKGNKTKLKDKNGNQVYVKKDGKFVEATYEDYNTADKFYLAKSMYRYTGWQTIDGSVYFYDKDGNYVTGEQVIQGAKYNFGSDGRLSTGSGSMGIDVSKHNGSIDWSAVKNSGVSYAIIRCGYRGYSTGVLVEDPKFISNIKGAKAAGLKVGVYIYSQAVNEVEAVEEASMALNLVKGYGLDYPIFIDVEASGGRADGIGSSARTAVCQAFCQTVQNSGYSAGVYSNKNWLSEQINTGSLTGYKIWLAQYAAAPTYTATRYDMWQYSSKGKVSGISGNVDMNISYLNY